MKHYVGLDLSVKETAISIVNETGRIFGEPRLSTILRICRRPWPNLVYVSDGSGSRLDRCRSGCVSACLC